MQQRRRVVRGGVVIMAVAGGLIVLDAQGSGGKTVTDVRKTCQITVPADWTADTGTAYSPDKKISATVHGMRAQAFDAAKTTFTSVNKPLKTLKDDGKVFVYTMEPQPAEAGKSGWAAVKNTTPVCTVALMFPTGTKETMLQAIVDSLAAAAK